jgi:DNA-binding response OmpR family regulator
MSTDHHILIVDADDTWRADMADKLLTVGYEVTESASIQDAETRIHAPGARFDAVILDVSFPDGADGRNFCATLRAQGAQLPLLIVTEQGDEHDVIKGMDLGATDYVVRPVRLGILLARLRAHIRAFEHTDDAVFTIGRYTFYPREQKLRETANPNRAIHLSTKEVSLIRTLHRAAGQSVKKRDLIKWIWGYHEEVSTHTLETHIYRLRQRIEPEPSFPRLLVTENGGYRLDPNGLKSDMDKLLACA